MTSTPKNPPVQADFSRSVTLTGAGLIFSTAWVYFGGVSDGGLLPKFVAVACVSLVASLIWMASDRGAGALSRLDVAVLAFLGVLFLCSLLGTALLRTGLELAKFTMLVSIYFAFSRLATRDHLLRWAYCLCAASLVVSVIGIGQFLNIAFLDWPTAGFPSATFSYRNMLAMYLVVVIPLLVVPFLQSRHVVGEIFAALTVSAALLLLIYTRTRGGWVGLAGAITLVGACLFWRRRRLQLSPGVLFSRRKMGIAAFCAVAILLGSQVRPVADRLGGSGQIPTEKASVSAALLSIASAQASGRRPVYLNTLELIGDHPLLGVGLMDWEVDYPPYDEGEQMRPGRSWRRPHNDYLWFAAELGLLGFCVYLGFLLCAAATAWRVAHRAEDPGVFTVGVAAATGFIALHGHAMFSFPRERIGPYAMAWFALALVAAAHRLSQNEPESGRSPRWSYPLASTLVSTIALTIGIRATLADHWNWLGYSHFLAGRPQEGEPWVNQAADLGVYDFHQLLRKSQVHQGSGHRSAAVQANVDVLALHPNSMAAHWNLANLHALSDRLNEAERHYLALIELSPTHAPAYRDLAAVYRKTGRIEEAWETCEVGLARSPGEPGLNYIYGTLNRAAGNLEEALIRFRAAGPNVNALRERSQVAQELGRIEEATTSLETLVAIDRTSAADYYPLAALYHNARQYQRALQAYERFVELWPDEDAAWATAIRRIEALRTAIKKEVTP